MSAQHHLLQLHYRWKIFLLKKKLSEATIQQKPSDKGVTQEARGINLDKVKTCLFPKVTEERESESKAKCPLQ